MFKAKGTRIPGLGLYTKFILTVIAVLLALIAFRPMASPIIASAESNYEYLYVEPGTTTVRSLDGSQQVQGKMVIDMRNGNVWGFPTGPSSPYP